MRYEQTDQYKATSNTLLLHGEHTDKKPTNAHTHKIQAKDQFEGVPILK